MNEKFKRGTQSAAKFRLVALVLVCLSLTACVAPALMGYLFLAPDPAADTEIMTLSSIRATSEAAELALLATAIAAATKDANATSAPAAASATEVCFFNWNTENDVDATQRLQAALDAAGIVYETAVVSAYGENEVCTAGDMQTVNFLVMDRTPFIAVPAPKTATPETMGATVENVLRAMEAVTIDKPRQIEIIFASTGTESRRWQMRYAAAFEAWQSGITGAALFEAGT